MALAASVNWWPVSGEDDPIEDSSVSAAAPLVEARDPAGNRWCGELVASERGVVLIATVDGDSELPLEALAAVAPVERC